MSNVTITKTIFFKAPRKTVWSFLTRKEKLAIWFHPPKKDLAVNEDYSLDEQQEDGSTKAQCWGKVLEMDEPSRMVWSFTIKPLDGAMTTVTWDLEEAHGGTCLTLTHKGIGKAAGEAALGLFCALDHGWDVHLTKLRTGVHGNQEQC